MAEATPKEVVSTRDEKIRDFIQVGIHVVVMVFAAASAIKLHNANNDVAAFWALGVVMWCGLDFVNGIFYNMFRRASTELLNNMVALNSELLSRVAGLVSVIETAKANKSNSGN